MRACRFFQHDGGMQESIVDVSIEQMPQTCEPYNKCVIDGTEYDCCDLELRRIAQNSLVELSSDLLGVPHDVEMTIGWIHRFVRVYIGETAVIAARCWVYFGHRVPRMPYVWKVKQYELQKGYMYVPI